MKVDTYLKRLGSYSNAAMSFVPKSWIVKGPNEKKLFNRRTTGSDLFIFRPGLAFNEVFLF